MSDFYREFSFAHPHFLWLLALLPLLALLRGGASQAPAVKFSSLTHLSGLGHDPRSSLGPISLLLTMIPLACGILALARPQQIRTDERVEDSGVEIMIALDVSLSMAIEDYKLENERVNRLTAAKKVIREFAADRKSDRIGLVAFAGRPYVASPLTMDQKWFNESLKRVAFNLVEDGTAIGSAIATAASRLDKRDAKSKLILLVTDGANNSGNIAPKDAAKLASTLGIRVYTISIGTPGKHNIPLANRGGIMPGVRQEFDDSTLREVAEISNGKFYKGQDTSAVQQIFKEIDQLEKTKLKVRRLSEVTELFPYPAVAALISALLALVFWQTLGRRLPA
jgi:Ca-activated chloride channel family protein